MIAKGRKGHNHVSREEAKLMGAWFDWGVFCAMHERRKDTKPIEIFYQQSLKRAAAAEAWELS